MKKVTLLLVACALSLGAYSGGAIAEDSKTLTGEFVWDQRGNRGDLEGVFTATGKDTWNVDFHFNFRGAPHTYSGTAEGSLSQGALSGTVQNESKERTFTFRGKFKKGQFSGTHSEVEGEKTIDTGTLTLG